MINAKDIIRRRTVKNSRSLSLRKLSVCVGLCLGAVVLAVLMLIFIFSDAILNGYGKGKAERAFAEAYPGCVLRIGKLDYAVGANRMDAQFVTLSATNTRLKIERISLKDVRWLRPLWGKAALADILTKASIDVMNLDMEFPRSHSVIRCARLRASVPRSELIAEGAEYRPWAGDEEFFAVSAFRTTRFLMVLPECRVSGLAFSELLRGKSYRAQSVHFSSPSFDALVNCDKPVEPFVKSPLMVNEALAAIRLPLQVDSLIITNSHLKYCERVVSGADPGVLTFSAVNMSIEGITNRGEIPAVILVRGEGDFMNAGVFRMLMTIPVASPDFSIRYSGSLSAMDLKCLGAFLELVEHIRIKNGRVQEVTFEIDVTAGHARGRVRAIYKDLEIALLDKQTGTEKGLDNHIASLLANMFKIRNSAAPDASGLMKEGKVDYTRRPKDGFLKFVWFSLRSGVLDVISY